MFDKEIKCVIIWVYTLLEDHLKLLINIIQNIIKL